MKKILMNFSMFFVFLFAQTSLFGNTATPPPGSFFNVSVSGLTLSMTTTSYNPNQNYEASIQITSPDYTIASGCALESSTSCHFPVNQNLTANIVLQGATSTVTYVLCLNATIPATCGTYSSGVVAGLALSPSSLPAASLSTAYSQTISASGGVAPYTYAITAGSLPLGLSLNGTTGEISGTPTSPGTYPFTVTATDSTAPTAITGSQVYSVVIYLQLANCVYSTSGNYLTCTSVAGQDLTTLGSPSSIYRHYSGGSCVFSGGTYNVPGTASLTATTYTTLPSLNSMVVGCNVSLCNDSSCSSGNTTSVLITAGT